MSDDTKALCERLRNFGLILPGQVRKDAADNARLRALLSRWLDVQPGGVLADETRDALAAPKGDA